MSRGTLTPEITKIAKKLLGIDITVEQLRLLPHIQYVVMNSKCVDTSKLSGEEVDIWAEWVDKKWLIPSATGYGISKEFWDAMSEILWLGYAQ